MAPWGVEQQMDDFFVILPIKYINLKQTKRHMILIQNKTVDRESIKPRMTLHINEPHTPI